MGWNTETQPNKSIFCILESKPCVCLNQWNDTHFDPLCAANQEGCTDCNGEGRAWCHTTEFECDGVEYDTDGNAQGWFYCGDEAVEYSTGVFFENINCTLSEIIYWSVVIVPKFLNFKWYVFRRS